MALATCDPFPPVPDDEGPLRDALRARGVAVAQPAWDDPAVAWESFDACLIRTTWDYMERRGAFLEWSRRVAGRTRLFHPPGVVAWNTHKGYLAELGQAGAPLADSQLLARGTRPALAAILAQRGWARAFIKPMVGATARRTLRVGPSPAAIVEAQSRIDAWLAEEDLLLQPYMASVETEGELSVVMIDGEITHGVRKVPTPGDYRVQDDFGATDALWEPDDEARRLARHVEEQARRIMAADLLYARVDFLRADGGGLVVNELEVVEPQLFFRHNPEAGGRLADALLARLGR